MIKLLIQDPSGESRTLMIESAEHSVHTIGNDPTSSIVLRDPTLPFKVGRLVRVIPDWRLILDPHLMPAKINGLTVHDAHLPMGHALCIGETRIRLLSPRRENKLPPISPGIRSWHTESSQGEALLWQVRKVAQTPLSAYLQGETGVGKEVIARILHGWSTRAGGPFIPLHCGALAPSLAESELFGHVKGAFTGAERPRTGALLQAHGGTLFLDEVGELSTDLQVKLLRFLEDGEIRPVGSDRLSHAQVRLVCATHRDLKELVIEGKFRQDLYFRLASVTLKIPPLRERPDDIKALAEKFAAAMGFQLSRDAVLRLQSYPWPGNVRELRHAIERACGFQGSLNPLLCAENFEFLVEQAPQDIQTEIHLAGIYSRKESERCILLRALKLAEGNRTRAAKIMGVARSTLFEMLKRHGIRGPLKRTVLYSITPPVTPPRAA